MDALVLLLVFLLTIAIGALLAKGVLIVLLQLVIEGPSAAAPTFKIAGFFVALILFWSLGPAIVENPVAAGLLALMR